MGLGFTIDTPAKVARFGISSVLSIVEDNIIEQMREYYCEQENEIYFPITKKEKHYCLSRSYEQDCGPPNGYIKIRRFCAGQ